MNAFRKSLAATALLAVIIINGWHLAIVQLYAWGNMAWNNSQSMEISPAIVKALDGRELCGICEFVIEKNNETNTFAYWQVMTKVLILFFLLQAIFPAKPKFAFESRPSARDWEPSLSEIATPPPRGV
ncbi:MAG: hypothetical protein AAGB46_04745 [Verrucomicrobiota bacterium]